VTIDAFSDGHIVHARYFDNWGFDAMTTFLSDRRVLDWIVRTAATVFVFDIRAQGHASPASFSRPSNSLEFLPKSIEAYFAASSSQSILRTDKAWRALLGEVEKQVGWPDVVRRFIVENRRLKGEPMSWRISGEGREILRFEIDSPQNRAEFSSFSS